jgi:hypothetical protein
MAIIPECAITPWVNRQSELTPLLVLVRQSTVVSVVSRAVAKSGRPSTMYAFISCFHGNAPDWLLKMVPPVKTQWAVFLGVGDTNFFSNDSPLD